MCDFCLKDDDLYDSLLHGEYFTFYQLTSAGRGHVHSIRLIIVHFYKLYFQYPTKLKSIRLTCSRRQAFHVLHSISVWASCGGGIRELA